jgi:hypothetical protein
VVAPPRQEAPERRRLVSAALEIPRRLVSAALEVPHREEGELAVGDPSLPPETAL